jgi:hypothetical protein
MPPSRVLGCEREHECLGESFERTKMKPLLEFFDDTLEHTIAAW